MDTKRPFSRVAGWAAFWLAMAALVLFIVPILTRPMQTTIPAAFAMTLVTLCALGVFVCVVASVLCGVVALLGMKENGRKGTLGPAASGLMLSGLMLIPIVIGMASGFAENSRLVHAREIKPAPVSTTVTSAPVQAPNPIR